MVAHDGIWELQWSWMRGGGLVKHGGTGLIPSTASPWLPLSGDIGISTFEPLALVVAWRPLPSTTRQPVARRTRRSSDLELPASRL